MARAFALATALVLLAAPTAGAATKPTGDLVSGSEETVLRLHDLPPGYQVGANDSCGPVRPPEMASKNRLIRRYAKWIVEHRPAVCGYEYEQVFEVLGWGPAPPQVTAATVNTPSEEASVSGFQLLTALLARFDKNDGTVPIPPSGVPARLFRGETVLDEGRDEGRIRPGSFLFWRHGKLIGVVGAAGLNPRRNDRAALHLAQIQQRRMEAPTPYTEAERDDTEVWLDDPGLKFPVYWVGRRFAPGQGLPAADLLNAFSTERGGFPGAKLRLYYIGGFSLDTWTRQSWKQFQHSPFGKRKLNGPCARTTEVELERGRAVVYAGYRLRRQGACPRRPPDRHWAIAHIDDVVIGVNLDICPFCFDRGVGRYNSLRGMKAIVRGLQERPKPVY
jgi:hypothetical protein